MRQFLVNPPSRNLPIDRLTGCTCLRIRGAAKHTRRLLRTGRGYPTVASCRWRNPQRNGIDSNGASCHGGLPSDDDIPGRTHECLPTRHLHVHRLQLLSMDRPFSLLGCWSGLSFLPNERQRQ